MRSEGARPDEARAAPPRRLTALTALCRTVTRGLDARVAFLVLGDDGDRRVLGCVGAEVGPSDLGPLVDEATASSGPRLVRAAPGDPRLRGDRMVDGDLALDGLAAAPILDEGRAIVGWLCVGFAGEAPADTLDVVTDAAVAASGLVATQACAEVDVGVEVQRQVIRDQAREIALRNRQFCQTERLARIGGWEIDLETRGLTWSPQMYAIHDMPVGRHVTVDEVLALRTPAEAQRVRTMLATRCVEGLIPDGEWEIRTATGRRRWVRTLSEVEHRDGVPSRLFGTMQDVTERHHADLRLWTTANRDALTGLANRGAFKTELAAAFAPGRMPPGLLMIDADHLKHVNDTLGHEAGDALLSEIARRITVGVGESGSVARLGGDEFAVIVAGPVTEERLSEVAQAILGEMEAPFEHRGMAIKVRVSIGGAVARMGADVETLYQNGDLALYHVKETRRGTFSLFDDGFRTAIARRMRAVAVVDRALAEGRVEAWYQPCVDLTTGRMTAVEALARIRVGDGVRSIGEYAEALDDPRTAVRLTERMLGRITDDVRLWQGAGMTLPRIAFNVGSHDIDDGSVERLLADVCASTGVAPSQFAIEVTETVLLARDGGVVTDTANRLRDLGVGVALDDFGTGYASLANLGTFPVDFIKLDRSFTAGMMGEGPQAAITPTIIALAHQLGIQVVAEGVETAEQVERLKALSCERAQGWHYARAMTAAALVDFARDVAEPTAPPRSSSRLALMRLQLQQMGMQSLEPMGHNAPVTRFENA